MESYIKNNEEILNQMIDDYLNNGLSIRALERKYSVERHRISKIFNEMNIKKRDRKEQISLSRMDNSINSFSEQELQDLIEDYTINKNSLLDLSKKYNKDRETIKRILQFLNIQIRDREEQSRLSFLNKINVEHPLQNKEIYQKTKQTCIEKYGVDNPMQVPEIKEKMKNTCIEKYGANNPMQIPEIKNKVFESKKKNGTVNTSKPEEDFYSFLISLYKEEDVCRQYKNSLYPYHCDFYIKPLDLYIELNLHFTHGGRFFKSDDLQCVEKLTLWQEKAKTSLFYKKAIDTWTIRDVNKYKSVKENNLNYLVFWDKEEVYNCINIKTKEELEQYFKENSGLKQKLISKKETYHMIDSLFGLTKNDVFNFCSGKEFPGSAQLEPNHPVWDCNVDNLKSPKQAWQDPKCIKRAVDNLFYILAFDQATNQEPDFVEKHKKAFEEAEKGNPIRLQQLIVQRWTVAKMDGQKVTMLSSSTIYNFLKENNIDLSNGVYSPMSGFGGIPAGAARWMKEHHKMTDFEINSLIETYDINPIFVKYFNYNEARNVLDKVIETNKTVIVCPPWSTLMDRGHGKENWPDTPQEMCDKSFVEWYRLIKQYIKAPVYYIFGPEQGGKEGQSNGLFKKNIGVQLYTDEDIERLKTQ